MNRNWNPNQEASFIEAQIDAKTHADWNECLTGGQKWTREPKRVSAGALSIEQRRQILGAPHLIVTEVFPAGHGEPALFEASPPTDRHSHGPLKALGVEWKEPKIINLLPAQVESLREQGFTVKPFPPDYARAHRPLWDEWLRRRPVKVEGPKKAADTASETSARV